VEQLSPVDSGYLATETAAAPGHIGWITVLDSGPGGLLTFDEVKRLVAERLQLVPALRRRLAPVPFGLDRPYWVEDPGFDLDFHLREIAVPPPGGKDQLADLVARLQSRPLDRSRPLWELYLIGGLEADRVALYAKVHFAAIDPERGTELMTALLDATPDERHLPTDTSWVPDRAPTGLEMLGRSGVSLLRPGRVLAFERRLAGRARRNAFDHLPHIVEMAVEAMERTPGWRAVARLLPNPAPQDGETVLNRPAQRAPRVSFNRPITPHRRVGFTSLPFSQLHFVKQTMGTTVNDVVIAVCAGALRRWLSARRELPADPLLALVPVLVSDPKRPGRVGYHVAAMVVPLPTNEADPLRRLEKTHQALRAAKERHSAMSASVLRDVSYFAPPSVTALAGRLVGAIPIREFVSPPYNVVISNTPGPRHPLYFGGIRQAASYPLSLVVDGVGLHISLVSNDGYVHAGLVACRESLPDLWGLSDSLEPALAEITAAIGGA
jgi:WS/DGAT/MGAT family acyltransferase